MTAVVGIVLASGDIVGGGASWLGLPLIPQLLKNDPSGDRAPSNTWFLMPTSIPYWNLD